MLCPCWLYVCLIETMPKKIFIILLLLPLAAEAQVNVRDSAVRAPLVIVQYAYQVPGADMAKRFHNNSSVGMSFLYKTKRNLLYGASGNFLFGPVPKESGVLDSISTSGGYIIGSDGRYAEVLLYERGWNVSVYLGKIIRFRNSNPNSGWVIMAGPGFLQHKIRIENTGNTAPQVGGDYRSGYDRLTNGFALSGFAGYMLLGSRRLINFYAGIELIQGWTKGKRYDFDLMKYDNASRHDLLYGLKAGWIIPLYKKGPKDFYFN